MKKNKAKPKRSDLHKDTMRPEYDFSGGARGVTAAVYSGGTNVIALDPTVVDVFPDSETVNEALRALAPMLRRLKRS